MVAATTTTKVKRRIDVMRSLCLSKMKIATNPPSYGQIAEFDDLRVAKKLSNKVMPKDRITARD